MALSGLFSISCASCRHSRVILSLSQYFNKSQKLSISTGSINMKITPKKGFKKSSADWLSRQLNDPYVKLAKIEQYRARSAFKLIQIDEKYRLLKPGLIVVDCGAAPGAWTQVIVPKISSGNDDSLEKGCVVSVDILPFHPIEGANILCGSDFRDRKTRVKIIQILKGQKVDLVLSDMAPNATGVKSMDHELIMILAKEALEFAKDNSKKGSNFLCKVWDGYNRPSFVKDMKCVYEKVRTVIPAATHAESSEMFMLGLNFIGDEGT